MIGYIECDCMIYDAQSLKEKRAVLQRVMTRLKQKFNISISEIDHQDVWQRTKIGIVSISSSKSITEKELQKVLDYLDSFPEIERAETSLDWL
ncbi:MULTISPECIES: DUF503 domain-containing protein [unclassified Bacillus (in: firmicutes)]|uniref:DUF503 domain-containing protein n=1 Tax=unclassified Bacillus (in: firmicutes) TaxID=185979 RepID=UPI0006CC6A0B|nr:MULTISPECIES: DUF503 family protein [unclassified Bacillus (in: firmicutes)]KPB04404.1 hypothetical protein AAV98_12670 [Bacillus sp. CHD6a]MEA3320148.1 DUF503 family protein [Bacillota bacterium]NMH74879.1 DUF503 family protein [Bacillus sp. RO2]